MGKEHDMLNGKRLVITGVLTDDSIAWHVARIAQEQGAEIVLTGFGRAIRLTERSANRLPDPPPVLELDINDGSHMEALVADLGERWGAVDGALHAIAYAPDDALGGNFLSTPAESASTAFLTSAFSYKTLAVGLLPLMREAGEARWSPSTSTIRRPGPPTTGWAYPNRRSNP